MDILLTSLFSADLNLQYTSDPIDLSAYSIPPEGLPITASGGTIVINDIDVGAEGTLHVGDQLRLRLASALTYATTTYASFTLTSNTYYWSITTKTDSTLALKDDFAKVGPFDLVTYLGINFTPNPSTNYLSIIDLTTEAKTVVNATDPAENVELGDVDWLLIANYFEGSVYQVSTAEQAIKYKLNLGSTSKPYSISRPFRDAQNNRIAWITLSNTNEIVKYDFTNYQELLRVSLPGRPLGVDVDSSGNAWVALYDLNKVAKVDGSTGSYTTIDVSSKPLEVTLDSLGHIWVTCSGVNLVARINKDTEAVTTVTVGNNPWGILAIDDFLYVSNTYSGTVSKIDVNTQTVTATIPTGMMPYGLSYSGTAVYVACYAEDKIQKIEADSVVAEYAVDRYAYGVAVDSNNKLWVVNYYPGLPSRFQTIDQTPDIKGLNSASDLDLNEVYTTNNITISGLSVDIAVQASITPYAGAYITKNGNNVGQSTTVINGDILSVSVPAASTYGTQRNVKLTVGDVSYSFTTITVIDTPIDYFHFSPLIDQALSTPVQSSPVTISGLLAGVTRTLTLLDLGDAVIVKNSVNLGSKTTEVQNGDTIEILVTSPDTDGETVYVPVQVDNLNDIFSVTTSGMTYYSPLPSYNLGTASDVTPGAEVTSSIITVSNIPDDLSDPENPIPVSIPVTVDPYTGTYLLKNGVNVGTSSTVVNGDTLQVVTLAPEFFAVQRLVYVHFGIDSFPFTIETIADTIPNPFLFNPVVDAQPRDTIQSNAVVVSGLSDGTSVTATVDNGILLVNGVESSTVQNGDSVVWEMDPYGPYGSTREYKLNVNGVISKWSITTLALGNAVPDPYLEHTAVIGVFEKGIARAHEIRYSAPIRAISLERNVEQPSVGKYTPNFYSQPLGEYELHGANFSTYTVDVALRPPVEDRSITLTTAGKLISSVYEFESLGYAKFNPTFNSKEQTFVIENDTTVYSKEQTFVIENDTTVYSKEQTFVIENDTTVYTINTEAIKHTAPLPLSIGAEFVLKDIVPPVTFEPNYIGNTVKSVNSIQPQFAKVYRPLLTNKHDFYTFKVQNISYTASYDRYTTPKLFSSNDPIKTTNVYRSSDISYAQAAIEFRNVFTTIVQADTVIRLSTKLMPKRYVRYPFALKKSVQFVKDALHDTDVYGMGRFDTAQEAINAGLATGRLVVQAFQMPDGKYVWTSDCSIPISEAVYPLYGYIKGG